MIRKFFETGAEEGGGMSVAKKVAEAGDLVGVGKKPDQSPVVVNEEEENEVRGILAGLRRDADSLHKTVEELATGDRSRALSLAITNFQEARQFLGCLLKERGSKSPYVLGNDSSTTALESQLWDPGKSFYETAESANPGVNITVARRRDHNIITAKKLREKAADVITDFTVYAEKAVSHGFGEAAMLPHVYTKLVAGRNWLGEYLGEKAKEQNAG
jgi:hypothetical protein